MRLLLGVFALALMPGVAHAKEYGRAGTIEIGGAFSAGSASQTLEDEGGNKTTTATTFLRTGPEVGFFILPGIEVLGAFGLGYELEDDESTKDTTTAMSFGAGGGVLLPVGRARIGPQLLLTYSNEIRESDDGNSTGKITLAGPGARLSAVSKLPIGDGGMITAGIYMAYTQLEISGDTEDTQTHTEFGTSIGVSIFF